MLSYITQTVKESLPGNVPVFADLDGHKVNGGTIPPHIMITSSRCDLAVIDSSTTPATVYLFELTVCFERQGNINAESMTDIHPFQVTYKRRDTTAETFHLKWAPGDT